ncbi:Gamma-tubulin complex component GCP6 [Rasamsonia emersonii CBS 393.64]|uniref:Spindle pole body component n=1 Tax=Rasamsonia emersonii (strain ATCC 16479 / CBS 393.64 / IMI 116815) TaxID=1408163 RepID=A0A0F4YYH0_RASE3|nr:Gamma-tubulin complex component GCP6 [Rasamsonia emersonii CBS 393.64]KKA23289.1 Gamma-tubulin complex component GCP6 [Rasamsonia emersonii CBS 393.64]
MDLEDDHEDPFDIGDLWKPSRFPLQPLPPLEPLIWDKELPDIPTGPFENPLNLFEKNDSLLYQLDVFGSDAVDPDPVAAPETVNDEAKAEKTDESDDDTKSSVPELENIWALETLRETPEPKPKLQSWDGFLDHGFREPASAYLSEFGARGFDAALAYQASVTGLENSGRLVRPDVFLHALFRLGLGWNSMFFHYNEQKRAFEKSIRDIRVSGVSLAAIDGLIGNVLQCGTDMQRIRKFVRQNPAVPDQPSALSSLAGAASVLVYGLEKRLSTYLGPETSLIQIQALFRRCGELVGTLADIVDAVEKAKYESEIISILLVKCDNHVQRLPWMADILHDIIARCTRPWLALVESWIGLRSEKPLSTQLSSMKDSFIEVEYSQDLGVQRIAPPIAEYYYRPEMMPSSVPADQARLVFETGKALRLLKQEQPNHPISREDVVDSSDPPALECAFSWADIEQIQNKASQYERQLRQEILRYHRGDTSKSRRGTRIGHDAFDGNESDPSLTDNFELIDLDDAKNSTGLLGNSSSLESDSLYSKAVNHDFLNPESSDITETAFGPPLASVLYLSLAPTLSLQARLVDYSCLHLLFKVHKLRYHLRIQWRFQLLGDGIFASRLSHALFDPEMASGERKPGVARSGVHTGLRLGNRDTWPPASSELRLVLMGLLAECHEASENRPSTRGMQHETKEKELPGGLSFAIRELRGEELVKCKDPNAIEALDFLRLQYTPPTVLESVITSRSLHKYDRLFKHLLRLLRMVSVVHGLVRDSTARGSLSGDTRNIFQKFRVDAQHFIGALNDYFFQIGVGSTWKRFESTLSKIERCLDRGDIDGTIETAGSLHRLRQPTSYWRISSGLF